MMIAKLRLLARPMALRRIFLSVGLLLGAAACGGDDSSTDDRSSAPSDVEVSSPSSFREYKLVCVIDTEGFDILIDGETGERTEETNGESRVADGDASGVTRVVMNVNRTLTYNDSGNVYFIFGQITTNVRAGTVSYDLAAAGDSFSYPQFCNS